MGDALAVLTAGFYAVYLIVMAAARERAAAFRWLSQVRCCAVVTLLPIVFLAGEEMLPTAVVDWVWLIGLAVISQVLGRLPSPTRWPHPTSSGRGRAIDSTRLRSGIRLGIVRRINVRSSTLGRRSGAGLHHRRAPFRALEDSIREIENTGRRDECHGGLLFPPELPPTERGDIWTCPHFVPERPFDRFVRVRFI